MGELLKDRLINEINAGNFGHIVEDGAVFTLNEFRQFFSDVKKTTANAFCSAAVIETGQNTPTHNKFLLRESEAVYRVHPDKIAQL